MDPCGRHRHVQTRRWNQYKDDGAQLTMLHAPPHQRRKDGTMQGRKVGTMQGRKDGTMKGRKDGTMFQANATSQPHNLTTERGVRGAGCGLRGAGCGEAILIPLSSSEADDVTRSGCDF
jgi:hypothetical protein